LSCGSPDPRPCVSAIAVGGLQQVDDRVGTARGRCHAEALGDDAPELVDLETGAAAEGHPIDRMQRQQHVANAHAARRCVLKHLHIVESIEPGEVDDRFAHVGDRERRADLGFKQGENLRIGDRLPLLLDPDLDDGRWGLSGGWGRAAMHNATCNLHAEHGPERKPCSVGSPHRDS
jgi:hypothetical protein